MRQSSACLIALGIVLALAPSSVAKDKKKEVPMAPLPSIVASAKTIFLSNGGGSNLAFDAFYAAMKDWGRYEIVGSPEEASLIVELSYKVEQEGTRVWSTHNAYTGATQVHSAQIVDPQLMLTIYDGKTKTQLWAETDHRRLARRQTNREKETVNSAQRLVDDLKTRVGIKP
jgi:hypothetical protein